MEFIKTRRRQPAFHPNAAVEIVDVHPKVFAVKRSCRNQTLHAVTNVTAELVAISLTGAHPSPVMTDLITGHRVPLNDIHLAPFQYAWLAE